MTVLFTHHFGIFSLTNSASLSAHHCNTSSLVTAVSLLSSCSISSIIAAKSLCLSLQHFFVLPCRISSFITATILRSSLLHTTCLEDDNWLLHLDTRLCRNSACHIAMRKTIRQSTLLQRKTLAFVVTSV